MNNFSNKDCTILIVDDNVVNLQVIGQFLKSHSYKIFVVTSAHKALELLDKTKPDLIILDILMPEVDGYELADIIKTRKDLEEIPIIFLTAKNSERDIIEGFKHGGVDFIIKPFNQDELILRVNTHIQLKISKDIIQQKNIQLEKLIRDKNEMLGIAAHDLKNPLTGINSYLSIIKNQQLDDAEKNTFFNFIENNVNRTLSIISDLLEVNVVEDGSINLQMSQFNINDILYSLTETYKLLCEEKNIDLKFSYDNAISNIISDKDRTFQIIDNLVSNAIKFSPKNTTITISSSLNTPKNEVYVKVSDQGPGFSTDDKEKLYTKFSRLSAKPTNREQSTGLGLYIVKKVVDLLNGSVKLISYPDHGATFIITLPIKN